MIKLIVETLDEVLTKFITENAMNPEIHPEFLLAFRDSLETLDKLKTLDYADIPGSMLKIMEVVDDLSKDSVDVDPSERTEYQKGQAEFFHGFVYVLQSTVTSF